MTDETKETKSHGCRFEGCKGFGDICDGGPAFPGGVLPDDYREAGGPFYDGMTLRDYFAANAPPMPEEWASYRRHNSRFKSLIDQETIELMAEWTWFYADAMLKARKFR